MWEIDVTNQIISYMLSLCLGALICALYDVIRALHKCGLNSFFAVFVTDVMFCILCAFLTFIFLMSRTKGEIRGYVLFGEALGFVLFRITVSKFLYFIFCFLFSQVVKLKRFLQNKINTIGTNLYNIFINNIIRRIPKFKSVIKSVKKLLKNRGKLLYTNKNTTNAENVLYETETKA